VFQDLAARRTRHVSYQPVFLFGNGAPQAFDVTGLPTCGGAPTDAAIAFSEMFECSDEQTGVLEFQARRRRELHGAHQPPRRPR
jgi:hypothetical protein